MRAALIATAPLLLGMAFIMAGNMLQGTLLGYRAGIEGFSTAVTGIVMTGFYVGQFASSMLAPRLVRRVGHVRTFGALAALAAVAILLHGLIVEPSVWFGLRVATGFAFAGFYIVVESWLNDMSGNETRAQLLGCYMVCMYLGLAGGQFLFTVADPAGTTLFMICAVLLAIAVVPVLLSVGAAPRFELTKAISLRELYRLSPLAIVGSVGVGLSQSVFFNMNGVFGSLRGMSQTAIFWFMALAVIGAAVTQLPMSRLADRFDRRRIIALFSFVSALAAFAAAPALALLTPWPFYIAMGLFGAMSVPLYALCNAHLNDYLRPEQMVVAGGGLILAYCIGAVVGPTIAGFAMAAIGPLGFLHYLATVNGMTGLFALYRMTRRATPQMVGRDNA